MYDTIVVPTDGSEGASHAIEQAYDLAAAFDATIHAVYVVDETFPAHSHYDVVREDMEGKARRRSNGLQRTHPTASPSRRCS